jgi:hypothetical protein
MQREHVGVDLLDRVDEALGFDADRLGVTA